VIVGEAHTTVGLSKRGVVDVVLEFARYRQADRKNGRVGEIARASDTGTSVGESRQRPPDMVRLKQLIERS
jgi:hypothetical protein